MELGIFALRHVVTKWNNTPRPDFEYITPEEAFNAIRMTSKTNVHFEDLHQFGITGYVLHKRNRTENHFQNRVQGHN